MADTTTKKAEDTKQSVGNVVTATGDIVGKDGGIVGKALPLDNASAGGSKKGIFGTLMGATKGVKGVVDTVDGTVQTVEKGLPLVGDLTKGLGLGNGGGGFGGLLGKKQEDRSAEDKAATTEQAKKELFDNSDKAADAAPIDLKDQEAVDNAKTEVETKSQPPQSEASESKDEATEATTEASTDDNETVKQSGKDLTDTVSGAVGGAKDAVESTASGAKDTVEDTTQKTTDTAEDTTTKATDAVEDTTSKATDAAEDTTSKATDAAEDTTSKAADAAEKTADDVQDTAEETAETAQSTVDDTSKDVPKDTDSAKGLDDTADDAFDTAEQTTSDAKDSADKTASDDKVEDTKAAAEGAKDTAEETAEDAKDAASEAPKGLSEQAQSQLDEMETVADVQVENPFQKFEGAQLDDEGKVIFDNQSIGKVVEGDPLELANKEIAPDGAILNDEGSEIGRVELKSEIAEDLQKQAEALAGLKDAKVNKAGNLVKNDAVIGRIVEGTIKNLIGRKADAQGRIWNDSGEQIGRAEPLADKEREEFKEPSPFEDFPDAVVQSNGDVTFEGEKIGVLVEGDPKKLKGKHIDEDGEVQDRQGNVIGRAERWEPEEEEPAPEVDNSLLAEKRVNKAGLVVDSNGTAFGRVVEGDVAKLINRMCNKKGEVLSESGEVIGRAELIPEHERHEKKDQPFENFPDAVVQANGDVTHNGEIVGRLIEGDAKKLQNSKVDADGDVVRDGNVIGKAERYTPEEPEPEPEQDKSILGGKRVNKAGFVVDSNGVPYGRVVEGDISRLVNRMCDKQGNVLSESGDKLGVAEVLPEGERELKKEGPFAELPGCTVAKDGTVVTPSGDIVGRLIEGDGKKLFGREVDDDGEILHQGNVIGRAERWEPEPEPEKEKGPFAGLKVNKQGDVYRDGELVARLTSGELSVCSGAEIDDDNDVINHKGTSVGHVTAIADIPEPEPEEPKESEEEKKAREEAEQDEKLAKNLASQVEQSLDKIRPICKMITDKIEKAERTPKDELDEEALVKEVKPLIEEGGNILSELNGTIRAMDPDGRIQRNAKHKSSTSEASPAEHHLADLLKELSGSVVTCVENAKKKIADMPHAKKHLNPLWALLTEPLGQILAAVGLLLAGVLNLVGRLLSGLGLGGIIDGLLGTLGLNRVLEGLGLSSITGALTGKNK
ncbi:LEA domain-containing protein [Verticillium dahliae VdLs.17]|uniref:LEA domain-containing protein n=1 Tax=Verticillium dahliae (strain VdLs.17 / ATCC MYA-4575 / FGSC 10137) TaxID=498257 RepID=G2XBE2_VERDV|nr:LEA domain-containing protein [Verticillium dahliae VdLs.17]EGY16116.1 LEA domain-containing protein [Verticillium dahliae VdLs.17]